MGTYWYYLGTYWKLNLSQTRTLESNVFTTKTLPIEYAEFAVLGDDTTEMIQSLTSTSTDSMPGSIPHEETQSENETEKECETLKREEESVIKDDKVNEALQLQEEECTIFDVFHALKRFIQGLISIIIIEFR